MRKARMCPKNVALIRVSAILRGNCTPPGSVLLGFLRNQVAVVDHTLLDEFIFDNFPIHVLQELDLFADESLQTTGVEGTSSPLLVSHEPVGVLESVLKHLKAILCKLVVQFPKVRDGANRGEDSVVLDR